jgi:hypothetical protein
MIALALRAAWRPSQQLIAGKPAVPLVHRFGERVPARARIIAVLSMPSFAAIRSALLKPIPRMSRASR